MSGGGDGIPIPVEVPDGDATIALLERIATAVEKTGTSAEQAGNKAKESGLKWTELKSAYGLAMEGLGRVTQLVDGVAALATEQQRLDETSARLGLNFNEAADGAGRFVDETEAMAAASQLAAGGLRLSQYEMNTLTQRAAITAQQLGVSNVQAFDMLTSAIQTHSTRALRPLGEDMLALAGASTTQRQVLDALMESTHNLTPATDDAASSIERMRDAMGDAQRTFASAAANQFVAMIAAERELSQASHGTADATDDMTSKLRTAGQVAGEVAMAVVHAVQIIANGVAMAAVALPTLLSTAGRALNELRHGNVTAAGDIMSGFGSTGLLGELGHNVETAGGQLYGVVSGETGDRARVLQRQAEERRATQQAAAAQNAGGGTSHGAAHSAHSRQRAPFTHRGEAPWSDQTEELFNRSFGESTSDYRSDDEILDSSPALNNARGKATARQAGADADSAASAARGRSEAERTKAQQRAAAEAEEQASISHRMGEILKEYGNTAKHVADMVVESFRDMTTAAGEHFDAFVEGRETLKQAGEGILHDTLSQVAKRASVFAIEEGVSAIASTARGDLPGAGLHLAAAAGFGVLAGLAGAAAQEFAPPPKSAAGGGASRSAANVSPKGSKSGGDTSTEVNVYFGGPVIGPGGTRQAARDIASILNDGARQGTVRLVPQLLR